MGGTKPSVEFELGRKRERTRWWPTEHPRWVVSAVALHAMVWGLWIGLLAGGAAGTVIFPLTGTIFGAICGLVVSVVPVVPGTVAVAVVASQHRRRADPRAFYAALQGLSRWVFGILVAAGVLAVIAIAVSILTGDSEGRSESLWGVVVLTSWLGVGPLAAASWTVHRLLPRARLSLTFTFARRTGWRPEERSRSG